MPDENRPFNSVSDDNIEKVIKTVLENRLVDISELAENLSISNGSTLLVWLMF